MVLFEDIETWGLLFNFHTIYHFTRGNFFLMYFIKEMSMANIYHMPPRLCSMFEGSGIVVSVKGDFWRIFSKG